MSFSLLLRVTSVHFSRLVVSDSLWPHEPQQVRPPCLSPTPRVYSNSCSLSQWCHPAISSSVTPFSSCLQLFPASGSFPMSQLFASGGQSVRVSVSTSVLPMNIQDWFPLGLTDLISLQSTRDSHESYSTPQFKSINFSAFSLLYGPALTSILDYWKNHSFKYTEFCLLYNFPHYQYPSPEWCICYNCTSTSVYKWHIISTQSPDFTWGFTFDIVHCTFGQMYPQVKLSSTAISLP